MNRPEIEVSGVALWRRVADAIEHGIADGRHPQGSRLPGETEIAETHRVNRHTVRRALAALAERGLVRAERGSGTYVEAPRIAYPLRSRTRFSENIGAGGREARAQLLSHALEDADRALAKRLSLKTGAPLVRLETLRFADRIPISRATTWLSAERFPDAARVYERQGSMTRTLSHFGIKDYKRAETRLTAAIVEAADAARLDLALGRPILLVESVDTDLAGNPLLTHRSRFAAERIQFVVEDQSPWRGGVS
jgi:GntR family phosphonate transport system transcriptional regulator